MKTLWIFLFGALLARSQLTAPQTPTTVTDIHDDFISTVDDGQKLRILLTLAQTAPVSTRDVQSLFDLFLRFPDERVRQTALSSLGLLTPSSPHLEPIFLRYLDEPEPEAVLFAIHGALRIRSPKCLPVIYKIAKRKFIGRDPQDVPLPSEKNAWWAQYQALIALAQWEPKKALPIIIAKTNEAPGVARIMAQYLWKESLPEFVKWASGSASNVEKARIGLTTAVASAALRETRPEMMRILRDPKADKELRHQLAIKLGLTSTEEEITALLKDYETLADAQSKLMFSAALFASRSRQVIPLLIDHMKKHPAPHMRGLARLQLKDMMGPSEYRALVEWAATNDPDPDNKQDAQRELRTLQ